MSGGLFRVEYGLDRILWSDPDADQLDVWRVCLHTGRFDDDADDIAWTAIARAELYGIDPDRHAQLGQLPFEVADAYSADASLYYGAVFDVDGRFRPDAAEQFEWSSGRALFLHDVQVDEQHRRRGYGRVLAADAILTLAPHGTAVFAHPGPTDPGIDDTDTVQVLRHETYNTRFLAVLGFVPFRDGLWSLDLSAGQGPDLLARIRKHDLTR